MNDRCGQFSKPESDAAILAKAGIQFLTLSIELQKLDPGFRRADRSVARMIGSGFGISAGAGIHASEFTPNSLILRENPGCF